MFPFHTVSISNPENFVFLCHEDYNQFKYDKFHQNVDINADIPESRE